MSNKEKDSCCISKSELKEEMELHKEGAMTPKENPSCTDVMLFRDAMSNAVNELPVLFQKHGFCCLVDTTEEFKKRSGKNEDPKAVPDMPNKPTDTTSKALMKKHSCDLLECQQAAHMKSIGIRALKETFPHCLALKEGACGLPNDFHLKDALSCVSENATSELEQASEFSSFMTALPTHSHNHIPNTKSLAQCLKAIETIKRKQDSAAPHEGTGINHITLINHTQNQIAKGVGGRRDPVHDIKDDWGPKQRECISKECTQQKIWDEFKSFCQKQMKLLDQQELITQKSANAKVAVIPNQVEINHDTNAALSGLKAQMDALIEQQAELTSAMKRNFPTAL